jgi:hypothetical protein
MPKKFISLIFSYNLPAGTLSSVLKVLFYAKILRENFYFASIFQSAQYLYEKREVSGSVPYILLMDLDPDPGGSKTCGSCASEYPTLSKNMLNLCRVSTTYSCYNSIPHSLVPV